MMSCFDEKLLNYIESRNNDMVCSLISSYNLVDGSGNTLLHYAAKCGNFKMAKHLIESGTSVDAQNEDGKTALILAMENCDSQHVDDPVIVPQLLLDAGASINILDNSGNSPLHLAIDRFINYELWRSFLKKLEIQFSFDYEKITNLLISIGCDLVDAMYVGCAEVTRIMLKRGYSPDRITWGNSTPLHLAVEFMHLENVKVLLEHGANVNVSTCSGVTPAFLIDVAHDDVNLVYEISKTLLEAGAQMYISRRGSDDIAEYVMQMKSLLEGGTKDVIRLLMKYDFDLNKHDENESTALHSLAYNENPGVFAELRDKSFGVDARNEHNHTPLWFAVRNPSSVKFLLDRGADVNAGNDYGVTALMKPFLYVGDERANLESIELLLQYGADVETIEPEGMTIFDAAVKYEGGEKLIEPVLAHLAMLRASGKPIPRLAAERISAHKIFQKRLDFYAQQVEEMKTIIVCQSITLRNLLIDNDDKIAAYMRNEELVRKLSRLNNKCGLTSYYHKYLRKRLTKAMQVAKLKEGAAAVLCGMIGLNYVGTFVIIDKIVDYLGYEDLRSLHYVYNKKVALY